MRARWPSSSRRVFDVQTLLRHGTAILGLLSVLGVISGYRTIRTYQSLRSDLEELLPRTAPSVRALSTLRERLPGLRYLGVVIDTGGPKNLPAAQRFVDALGARVGNYPKTLVAAVRADINAERRFAETYAVQLLRPEDVRELRESAEIARDAAVSKSLGIDLEDAPESAGADLGKKLRQKYESRYSGPRYPGDRFVSDDGRTRVLLIQAGSHATGYESDQALLDRVKADVAALDFPHAYAKDMRIGYAGDVATRVEELRGLLVDLGVSGVLVLSLVLVVLLLFFRSWRALPILGLPLCIGTTLAFGLVAVPPLSIRQLNSNTAFLASIIVGNGVNCGIILLARFREELRGGRAVRAAVEVAVERTWVATFAVALAASASYGCLVLTDFRGFNQFGWIGALGMLTCWACTYLLSPILMQWLGAGMLSKNERTQPSSENLLMLLVAKPKWVLAVTLVLLVACAAGLVKRRGDYLEYDLSMLRRRDSWVSGERYWGKRMDAVLKRYLTPTLVMADSAEQARLIERRLRELMAQNGGGGLIGSIVSAQSLLPPYRAQSLEEGRKLARVLTPRIRAGLKPAERELVERALSPQALHPLDISQLPEPIAAGLREKSGRMDRNVLVYPKLGAATWDLERMTEFTRDIRDAATVSGRTVPVAGSLLLSSDIAGAVRRDGPSMTLLSLLMVLAVCIVTFRSVILSGLAVASLAAGVVLMLGALSWAGARLKFSNFVALPITFGIAADYSINVLKRFQSDPGGSIERALASTGGAVAVCSATTIIGYGSLLAAQNRALFSFGVLAVAGEVACLLTAIVVLPAVLRVRGREMTESAESRAADTYAKRELNAR